MDESIVGSKAKQGDRLARFSIYMLSSVMYIDIRGPASPRRTDGRYYCSSAYVLRLQWIAIDVVRAVEYVKATATVAAKFSTANKGLFLRIHSVEVGDMFLKQNCRNKTFL